MTEPLPHQDANRTPINLEVATQVAERAIREADPTTNWVLRATEERDFGWVFFYTTAEFANTADRRFLKPGNGPLVVDRNTGAPTFLSSSVPPDRAIAVFEARWRTERRH
jgi:hypothetical protein